MTKTKRSKTSQTKQLDAATQTIVDRLRAARAVMPEHRREVIERIDRSIELNTRIGACTSESALQEIEAVARSYRLADAYARAEAEARAAGDSLPGEE